jgi:hypothetical protein
VEPCREDLPLTLGLRQMQFKNDVRCAVRRSGRRRRPCRHGCAAAPACRTFSGSSPRPWSTVNQGVRSRGRMRGGLKTEPLTATLDCIATSQLRPIAGFLER